MSQPMSYDWVDIELMMERFRQLGAEDASLETTPGREPEPCSH
jgi:hypothetical protein